MDISYRRISYQRGKLEGSLRRSWRAISSFGVNIAHACVMKRFPQAIAWPLAYGLAAIATSPTSLPTSTMTRVPAVTRL